MGALLLAVPAWSLSAGAHTELTSVSTAGEPAHGDSSTYGKALDGNGGKALFSVDDDALPGADGTRDIYVRDRQSDSTTLVSRATSGTPANDSSGDDPAISTNGRFVAFTTSATNLPGGVGGGFVRDLENGTTKLFSSTSGGDPASGNVERPVLSEDGRFVAFESDSDNLPGMDGTIDVYVHDLQAGRTTLISRATDGTPVDTNSAAYPSISATGRFVVFSSDSDVLGGNPGTTDVFIRDRRAGTTRLVSKTSDGVAANGDSGSDAGSLSGDGRLVAFESGAPNLGGDPAGSVFVRNQKAGTTKLVSKTLGGDPAAGDSPAIAARGRFVAYESDDDDLPGQNGITNVLRYDRTAEATILVSRTSQGTAANDDSLYASISGAGGFVAFTSRADNLSSQDDNAYSNTYVRGPLP